MSAHPDLAKKAELSKAIREIYNNEADGIEFSKDKISNYERKHRELQELK